MHRAVVCFQVLLFCLLGASKITINAIPRFVNPPNSVGNH